MGDSRCERSMCSEWVRVFFANVELWALLGCVAVPWRSHSRPFITYHISETSYLSSHPHATEEHAGTVHTRWMDVLGLN